VNSNKNLKQIFGEGNKELKMTYGGKELGELSSVSYVIANRTKKNLDKIRLYFEIYDKDFLPVFYNVLPPKIYPKEAVTFISAVDGVYVYEIEYMNRTESIWDGLGFAFYFAGGDPPEITLKTGTKGVAIKKYQYESPDALKVIILVFKDTWWFLPIFSLLVYFSIRFNRFEHIVKEQEMREFIAKAMTNVEGLSIEESTDSIITKTRSSPAFRKVVSAMFKSKNA
jgi:hypothetical protein